MTERVGAEGSSGLYGDLLHLGVPRRVRAGETLVREGDESDTVFVVVSGELTVSVASSDGDVVVARSKEGELIGEVAAMAGLKRSASIRAETTDVDVVAIDAPVFLRWLEDQPDLAARITEDARNRLNNVQVAEMAIEILGAEAAEMVPRMIEMVEWCHLDAGQVLFAEGDEADAVYFVLSGRLQVTQVSSGETEVLGEIGRAEIVGEVAVIQRTPRSATVTALRDTTLARFVIDEFESMLVSHPALTLMVLRRMVARIASPRGVESKPRSVAVIVTTDMDVDDIIYPMLTELHLHGMPAHVSSTTVDAALGSRDISQAQHAGLADARLAQYLHEVEAANDHMLYVADREPTAWSRRAIQRADCVIVVASARPDSAEQRLIRAFLEACTNTKIPRWMAIIDNPNVSRPTPGNASPVRSFFSEVHHIRRGNDADLSRLMRLAIGAGCGLVLGGGGARGFAHLGVINALNELGVPIDRVGGASMGSIFAALAALYQDPDQLLRACEHQFKRLLDYTVPVVALLKAKRITENLHSVFGGLDAEDLWIPFYCVSTNLTRSRLEVHRRGNLVSAIRASIAIPGVLPPVPFGEELLIDGGVLNNVPADVMRADPSIGTVIAVDVAASVGPGTKEDYGMYLSGWQALRKMGQRSGVSYPGVASLLIRTMITGSESKRVDLRRNGTVDLYLDLEMSGVGLLEFDKMKPVVDKGYRAAYPRIAAWLGERASAEVELAATSGQ